ncbi:MAG TPA: ElyC/SanA/YdcF family protein, partial [Methylomirabilota bacterium]|nr:ElyC/SanA/YdcF family protein [Methylomirabilota bacterium]
AGPATPAREVAERLGVDLPRDEDVARRVLRRLGVRPEAIRVAPAAGGTNATVAAIARHAREHGVRRLIVVTRRSHTRRVATLLRHRLPEALVMVRAAPRDGFDPERWWHDREDARELVTEALRWLNSVALGDLWAGTAGGAAVR